jgi:hypothetical protein
MRAFIVRIGFSLALVAAVSVTVLPTYAADNTEGPTLLVANPNAGDMVTPGRLIMEGVAFDPTAAAGVGVDRVSVFLGSRDFGGEHLGDATLGKPNFMTSPTDQFDTAGWVLTTPVLKGFGDGETLFIYAHSAVTGAEAVTQIPVVIGEKHTTPTISATVTEPTEGSGEAGTPSD